MPAVSDIPKHGLLIVTWLGFSVATILTGFRLYVRRVRLRRFYWDDAFHCLAWSILLVNAALYTNIIKTIYDVTLVTTGGGILTASFLENEVPRYINFQFVTNLLFWSVLWSVKLAFLLFYRRFFKGLTKHMIAWWCVLAFTLSGYIASVSIFLNVCGPPAAYFQINACLTEKSIAHTKLDIIFSTAVDISSDLMIMALPLRILWDLHINSRQKAGLAVAFSLAVIVIVFSIIRAVETLSTLTPSGISSLERADPISLCLYSVLESTVAVIVSCLPSFRVLFLGKNTEHRDCEHRPQPPSFSSSLGKGRRTPRSSWKSKNICPGCGKVKPRVWLNSISYDSGKTLTTSRAQESQRTAESDRTLIATPMTEMTVLSPKPVKPGSLEMPRIASLEPLIPSPVDRPRVASLPRTVSFERARIRSVDRQGTSFLDGPRVSLSNPDLSRDKPLPAPPRSPSPIFEDRIYEQDYAAVLRSLR